MTACESSDQIRGFIVPFRLIIGRVSEASFVEACADVCGSPAGFSSCATLLLLQLLALNWRTSVALPLPGSADKSAQCASLFKNLLLNIKDLLKSEFMCYRLMKSMEVTVRSPETVQACAPTSPQNSGCAILVNSSFSESECVTNIMKDLAYYDAALESYLESPLHMPEKEVPLLRPTLGIIQNLRKNCSSVANEGQYSFEDAANLWKNNSYANRQKMCKMMRGFHVRAITINRAMGYISSGEHRK
ncbi:interleukin-12 subunit alpha [Fundulus heteroclitus]|uniref:interleukin-12 subunit alpha n=1 Tax=Fundulus heteroclitus TaxID=8078 RepID=UPI00165CE318|nr:interleukin-12 subunit alpha [Fundulus heteroclitus]